MLKVLSSYRAVLCFITAIALIEFTIFLYLTSSGYDASTRIIRFVVPSALVFGIWVQSKIARYVGAAWFAISAVFLFWNLIAARRLDVLSILLLIAGILSLAASLILLFSKTFSVEFSHNREMQPRYKNVLRLAAFVAIIASMVAGAYNDIVGILERFWGA